MADAIKNELNGKLIEPKKMMSSNKNGNTFFRKANNLEIGNYKVQQQLNNPPKTQPNKAAQGQQAQGSAAGGKKKTHKKKKYLKRKQTRKHIKGKKTRNFKKQ